MENSSHTLVSMHQIFFSIDLYCTVLYQLLLAGRKVAVDASMSLYQFLIAVRMEGSQLTDSDGETTRCVGVFTHVSVFKMVCISLHSHLIGFFYRTIRMLENGIKPV